MSSEREAVRYAIDPTQPFPKRWRDRYGPIRVMAGPVQGYLMCRRPQAVPFVLSVAQMLNAETHLHMGPFELVSPLPHDKEAEGR